MRWPSALPSRSVSKVENSMPCLNARCRHQKLRSVGLKTGQESPCQVKKLCSLEERGMLGALSAWAKWFAYAGVLTVGIESVGSRSQL